MSTTFTIQNPTAKATDSQVSYLTSLIGTRVNPVVIAQARFALASQALTKGMASNFIDKLKNSPVIPAKAAVAQINDYKADLPMVSYGYYQLDGETLYCFDEFKQGGSTKIKFMKLTKTQAYDYKLGKYVPKGKWTYAGSKYLAKKMLAGQTKLTMDAVAKIGKQVGFCIRCGRTLTDPESVANGIGPVCATYVNWG